MTLEIDQELIDTTECTKNFACLSGEKEDLLEVTETLGYNMVVFTGPTPINCQHSSNYGGLHACKCPIRVEIYKKHGK